VRAAGVFDVSAAFPTMRDTVVKFLDCFVALWALAMTVLDRPKTIVI
jgi:hypothetical protein